MKKKELIEKIEDFLKKYNLANNDKTIIIGFSGGYDSMCLADVLDKLSKIYGFKLIAAHLNHNWRKEESYNEAQNCKQFCASRNITFYTETLDENEKHTETRARELRYEFFNKTIEKFNADALFTAHTKSDIAETLIYRIIKGTGIKGLKGISPKLNKIYRPMLDISRKEIEKYIKENDLLPNNDSSNNNNDYSRNYIRNEILPQFKRINPEYEVSLASLALIAEENEHLIQEYIDSLAIFDENRIITEKFISLSNALQKRIIYEIFVKYDFEYTKEKIENTLDFVLENFHSKSGKKYSLDTTHWLFVSSKFIEVITNTQKISTELKITSTGSYKFENYVFEIEEYKGEITKFPLDSEFKAFVELKDDINFTLRTRKNGDIITPLGAKGKMKLKKYLIEKNVPQHKKDEIILLCKDTEILWAAGLGVSEKIKVVNKCTHVLTLKKDI